MARLANSMSSCRRTDQKVDGKARPTSVSVLVEAPVGCWLLSIIRSCVRFLRHEKQRLRFPIWFMLHPKITRRSGWFQDTALAPCYGCTRTTSGSRILESFGIRVGLQRIRPLLLLALLLLMTLSRACVYIESFVFLLQLMGSFTIYRIEIVKRLGWT